MSDQLNFQTFYEFWRHIRCPACCASNWLYDSHSLRSYPMIHNACECHSCGHKFWVGEKEEFEDYHGGQLEDMSLEKVFEEYVHFEKGQKTPGA